MATLPPPLAIFGGTFDPVHLGHLRVAYEAAEALDAEVRLMPSNMPPHRPQPGASAQHRLAMLRVALAGQDRLVADDRELMREGYSYTIDTLHDLRLDVGGTRPLILLIGADAFAGLTTWRRWTELFGVAHIVVLTRPGHRLQLDTALAREMGARAVSAPAGLRNASAGRILSLPVTPLEISASAVRELLWSGRDPRFLLPDRVLQYIRDYGLYGRLTPQR
jgi:nicotinate-nucleotide adenylyltransferase